MNIDPKQYPFLAPFDGCADPHTFATVFSKHPLDDEQLEFFAAWMLDRQLWDPFLWMVQAAGGMEKLVPRVPGLFDKSLSMKPSAARTLLIRHGFLRVPFWMLGRVKTWRRHPLHAVVRKGSVELLSALLTHNPYFEQLLRSACTQEGRTLLFEANTPKMAKKLLELRVPLDAKDQGRVIALDHHLQKLREQAVGNRALEQVVGVLMGAHVQRRDRMTDAAALALDYPHVLDHLLDQGLHPNQRLEDGTPMLSAAVSRGDELAVLALLEAGADPTLCDNSGKSALDCAQGRPMIAHQIQQQMARALSPDAAAVPSLSLGKSRYFED
jgi:hypothetical protein